MRTQCLCSLSWRLQQVRATVSFWAAASNAASGRRPDLDGERRRLLCGVMARAYTSARAAFVARPVSRMHFA